MHHQSKSPNVGALWIKVKETLVSVQWRGVRIGRASESTSAVRNEVGINSVGSLLVLSQVHPFDLITFSWPKGENTLDRFGSVA
jgi:hypothetical protein